MGKAKSLSEKWKKLNEEEGTIATWNRQTGAATVHSGTKSYEVKPELVKSFGDEKQALDGVEVEFTISTVDGVEMVTSLSLKGQ